MTTAIASPSGEGYGWRMDDSARLRAEVARRADDAQRSPRRAPIRQILNTLAARQGVDLRRMNDPELGDRLLAEAERNSHLERIARQADILLARLPSNYRSADFPRTHFGQEAREWLDGLRAARAAGQPYRNLVILAPTGTGKTWTLCAIARALLMEDTVPVTVTSMADMLAAMRPAAGGLDVDLLNFASTPVLGLD